jgi:hypothetical protein
MTMLKRQLQQGMEQIPYLCSAGLLRHPAVE